MSIRIRAITDEDIAAVCELYNHYVINTTITFETEPLSVEEYTERVKGVCARYPFLVAEDEGRIVGFAYLSPFNVRHAYRFVADLSLYVDHDEKGKGIGSLLMKAIEEEARNMHLHQLFSLITSENENSRTFHEKHGFVYKVSFADTGFKFNRWLGVDYYVKVLEEPCENPLEVEWHHA